VRAKRALGLRLYHQGRDLGRPGGAGAGAYFAIEMKMGFRAAHDGEARTLFPGAGRHCRGAGAGDQGQAAGTADLEVIKGRPTEISDLVSSEALSPEAGGEGLKTGQRLIFAVSIGTRVARNYSQDHSNDPGGTVRCAKADDQNCPDFELHRKKLLERTRQRNGAAS